MRRPAAPRRSWPARLGFIVELWEVLRRPSSVFGLARWCSPASSPAWVFWGAFNTALELTNTEKFCTGCHEIDNVFAELKSTIHFINRSGVRATCPIATSRTSGPQIARKMQASKEVWGTFSAASTPGKNSSTIASNSRARWARSKANDSLECRNCHSTEFMDITKQSPRASVAHQRSCLRRKTCIDCHKGIAHKLPDMRGVPGWHHAGPPGGLRRAARMVSLRDCQLPCSRRPFPAETP